MTIHLGQLAASDEWRSTKSGQLAASDEWLSTKSGQLAAGRALMTIHLGQLAACRALMTIHLGQLAASAKERLGVTSDEREGALQCKRRSGRRPDWGSEPPPVELHRSRPSTSHATRCVEGKRGGHLLARGGPWSLSRPISDYKPSTPEQQTAKAVALDEPSPEQVAEVAKRTADRVIKLLEMAGRHLDSEFHDDEVDEFVMRQPALASLYAAAARGVDLSGDRAGQPTMRLIQQDSVEKKEPHAVVGGINIHAAVAFDARDRPRMERMCSPSAFSGRANKHSLARPPIAQHRLTRRPDGSLRYEMKKAWRDGTHAIVLQPLDLIARICAMIPPPRFNMIRFHGSFGPNAKLRSEVVPKKESRKLADESASTLGDAARSTATERLARFGAHADSEGRSRDSLPATGRAASALPQEEWLEVCTDQRDINRVLALGLGLGLRPPPSGLRLDSCAFRFERALTRISLRSPLLRAEGRVRLQIGQPEQFGEDSAQRELSERGTRRLQGERRAVDVRVYLAERAILRSMVPCHLTGLRSL